MKQVIILFIWYCIWFYFCSVESEQLYAKSLSKMASKLNKACREVPGTLADAWRNVAAEMESRSEVHRQFSTTMTEEIVKPLKQLLDNQHKTRKSVIYHNCFYLFGLFVCSQTHFNYSLLHFVSHSNCNFNSLSFMLITAFLYET